MTGYAPFSANLGYSPNQAQKILLFLFHITLLCGFSLYAFRHNSAMLYAGNDGPWMVSLAYEQLRFFGISTDLHTNFLQGLGNISYPMNLSVIPAFWFRLYELGSPSIAAITYTYTWVAVITFSTVMLVGWNHQFPLNARYAAAWLLTILFFPYFPSFAIYSATASGPVIVINILAAALIDIGIWRIGKNGWFSGFFYAGIILLGIVISFVTWPAAIILIAPFLGVSAIVSFVFADRKERIQMLVFAVALLLLMAACGWIEYVLGLLLNTSSGFFIRELLDSYKQDRVFVSIFFQGQIDFESMGPWLFIAGSLGAINLFLSVKSKVFFKKLWLYCAVILPFSVQIVLAILWGQLVELWGIVIYYEPLFFAIYALWAIKTLLPSRHLEFSDNASLRAAATILLSGQASLLIAGEWLMHRSGGWTGPALVYCEEPFFIFYALFFALFVSQYAKAFPITHFAIVFVHKILPAVRYNLPLILVAGMTAWIWGSAVPLHTRFDYAMPPSSSPLTKILEQEIGIHSGALFAGRVVTANPDQPYRPQFEYFRDLNALLGNDYQSTGLWLKGIPTLLEYSPLITPEFYTITHRFLSAPGDIQNRSWSNFSRLDLSILRLLGVRFILSTAPYIKTAKERAALPVPRALPLHLFELSGANVAGISARKIALTKSISEAEDIMATPVFNSQTAILIDPEHKPAHIDTLIPAKESRISIEDGAFRVVAKSDGWTMLILPIEYSRCMNIKALSGTLPQAVRVDIALIGLIFDHKLDVSLVQKVGPFTHPRCRFKDYLDFRAIYERQ